MLKCCFCSPRSNKISPAINYSSAGNNESEKSKNTQVKPEEVSQNGKTLANETHLTSYQYNNKYNFYVQQSMPIEIINRQNQIINDISNKIFEQTTYLTENADFDYVRSKSSNRKKQPEAYKQQKNKSNGINLKEKRIKKSDKEKEDSLDQREIEDLIEDLLQDNDKSVSEKLKNLPSTKSSKKGMISQLKLKEENAGFQSINSRMRSNSKFNDLEINPQREFTPRFCGESGQTIIQDENLRVSQTPTLKMNAKTFYDPRAYIASKQNKDISEQSHESNLTNLAVGSVQQDSRRSKIHQNYYYAKS
ncbi:UNKNOWN [Stylonychia lemnae]|uniref:Uncharacterized protein n=1 Tax=Stylonychia lemnae TaxID=5949 RepID=A0A078ALH8_STYLE|nr:UNKNOWN [Stylonychia lemnae]|eukprot:CDW81713.1 UNKNOWN [Stylonychia lemnae]